MIYLFFSFCLTSLCMRGPSFIHITTYFPLTGVFSWEAGIFYTLSLPGRSWTWIFALPDCWNSALIFKGVWPPEASHPVQPPVYAEVLSEELVNCLRPSILFQKMQPTPRRYPHHAPAIIAPDASTLNHPTQSIPCLSSCHLTTTEARNFRWCLPHYTSLWILFSFFYNFKILFIFGCAGLHCCTGFSLVAAS